MDHWSYILVDGRIIRATPLEWARWFESSPNRTIERTEVAEGIEVSTVFLGLDHRFVGKGPPLLLETMVFGGNLDQYQERYATIGEAKEGHFVVVEMVRMDLATHAAK